MTTNLGNPIKPEGKTILKLTHNFELPANLGGGEFKFLKPSVAASSRVKAHFSRMLALAGPFASGPDILDHYDGDALEAQAYLYEGLKEAPAHWLAVPKDENGKPIPKAEAYISFEEVGEEEFIAVWTEVRNYIKATFRRPAGKATPEAGGDLGATSAVDSL